ncbi:two component transcriptional regulator, LytTR family [Nonlabens sp. Hel1_33_55]|uniref:LytR/AlgR family response regulator transcription factor n=1 Tax=Nonlabens sp. Hel1_33_55 TaxID=1336802 RepID=UPI000875CCC5|nr:LytTR family DNA-binding domain-containing protein [Nonlabens sp. Hel1_33_55]SCY00025.1 two component transcriptional regulator, LytTR family [Nonlabens sp. Hel1_33_55]
MKILIVEDEIRIANRVEKMAKAFFSDSLEFITSAQSLLDAKTLIKDYTFDLVLLDLNLNGEDGFNLLKNLSADQFHTIVISANKEQALRAFELEVIDFIPKPFNEIRLFKAFNRISRSNYVDDEKIKFLAIKKRGEIKLIDISEVIYFKGAGVYTEVFLINGNKELHDKSLESLSQLLPHSFVRTHKSYLVKLNEINTILISTGSQYSIELNNEDRLPVGRTRYKEIKKKFFNN